jgi:spermidine synthase
MPTGLDDERQQQLVLDYFGRNARVRLLRRARAFGAPIFVVDFDQGVRHFRTLGSFGTIAPVTEQSSMDVLYPARLVFHYERLMSLAFALSARHTSALLLGVGGAAMWRFVRAYLPDCAMTLVDADPQVVAIARRWFFLTQPVVIEPAQEFVARAEEKFDAVLVDLYDARGPADTGPRFWERCLDALAPGGCLANNWADFATNPHVRPLAAALSEAARARGLEPVFVTRRGFRDNLVQFVPTAGGRDEAALTAALDHFARGRHLPDQGRGILENCLVGPDFPNV